MKRNAKSAGLLLAGYLVLWMSATGQAQTPVVPASPPPVPIVPRPLVTQQHAGELKQIILIQPPPSAVRPTVMTPRGPVNTVVPSPVVPVVNPQPLTAFEWDHESLEVTAEQGQASTHFVFNLKNITSEEVLVNNVRTSCGCTVAKLPESPWKVEPGAGGPIEVTMDLRGKSGTITKAVTVETSQGNKTLIVKSIIPAPTATTAGQGDMNRLRNMQIALADRQAVFKNDCASCHVDKGKDKMGKELYAASCGICHDSEHRAGSVPDLYTLRHPTNAEYWSKWIREGKDNTMMPAFAAEHGGPLTEDQIKSLVDFLTSTITAAEGAKPAAGGGQ